MNESGEIIIHLFGFVLLLNLGYKLLNIEEKQFAEKSSYQLGMRTTNVCIMDICWSGRNESLAVSCGSNGELHKLHVSPSDISLDYTIQFHERTINKVNFHPSEENLLISGGQDAIIKLIDFRCRTDHTPMASFKHDNDDIVTGNKFTL
jgi:WD40 repeat protein